MEIAQWIVACLLLLLGGFIAVMNWAILAHQLFRNGSSSFGPLLGGLLLVAGMAILPVEGLRAWSWTGLFLDFGCVPWLLLTGVCFLLGAHKQVSSDEDHNSNS